MEYKTPADYKNKGDDTITVKLKSLGLSYKNKGGGKNMINKKFIFMAAAVIIMTGAAYAATGDLPRSGQTTCYDASGNVIACAGTGQDGELLKGITWPIPRFTANADTTVTDNLTRLVWTSNADAPGPAACTPSYSMMLWQDALDYVACLNINSYLGHNDWRLPNINELESLVDAGHSMPNTQEFYNVQASYYWSSTTSAVDTSRAWEILMYDGHYGAQSKLYNTCFVWPVRAGQ